VKIVIADKISERGMELLRAPGWQIAAPAAPDLPAALAAADGLIVRSATRVTSALLAEGPRLRVVGRAGVGVDNVDCEAATLRGVLVMNTPGGNAVSVAEHAFALLLSLARSVPQLNAALHAGRWEKSGAGGVELRGKTLGLVGLGRVGAEVARRARVFEMRVVAHDPYITPEAAAEAGVELLPLGELLAGADVVSLHTALSPATERIVNAAFLARMKRGARLINTARGELVDEIALAEALRSGHLAGAALDVFSSEPPRQSPLLGLPGVVATPHVAGATQEAQEEVGVQIAQQVRDYLADGVIRNAVNLPALSADQYRRVRPYLDLAERLGALAAQVAREPATHLRVTCAGVPAELGTPLLRNAVLAGVLNTVLEEKANLVNAGKIAAARGLAIEEETRRREHGFPDRIAVTAGQGPGALTAEGTVLHGTAPRLLALDGIDLEAPLEGNMLFTRNRDVPGVIGQIGTALGALGVNVATFALGRREAVHGAEALALIRVDGEVTEAAQAALRGIAAITEVRRVCLPARAAGAQSAFAFR
jgi:D-3-phosphoglycerate dehydrogenase